MTKYRIFVGDVEQVAKGLDGFDAFVCDPPYGLSFMGKGWDHSVPSPELWRSVYGALKPGAHGFAFGGTRQFHRLVCGIEDAGFDIRDALMWLYGSGFPKSHNVSKAIDKAAGVKGEAVGMAKGAATSNTNSLGAFASEYQDVKPSTPHAQVFDGYGTAIKPAYEPICMCRKPLGQSVASNSIEHNTGALNIDGARIGNSDANIESMQRRKSEVDTATVTADRRGHQQPKYSDKGRWPANVVMDEEAGKALDAQSGESVSTQSQRGTLDGPFKTGDGTRYASTERGHNDSGGASRFFYCAKASREEREAGLHNFTPQIVNDGRETSIDNAYQRGDSKRRNIHPTVKPVDLIRWLATLALPPKREGFTRRVLVPFSGSGSEMIGCLLAGWDEVVGIEINPEYADIARARLAHWERYRCASSEAATKESHGQESMF